ncbi:MAG: hypothetical protein M3Q65_10845 [Chloroflexota bacterium]|nr:hypothetical protein [Chloroflexota bacterium]
MAIPEPTRCSFFFLEEGTKNENVAVGWNGDIIRWAKTGGREQQWLLIPISEDRCKIMTRQNGEYMAVGWDGDIIRWADSGGREQEFSFVNKNSLGQWNIQEGTKNEFVAVGWNGDVIRWAQSNRNDQRFKLVAAPGEKVRPSVRSGQYSPGQIPDVPRVTELGKAPPEKSPLYLVGEMTVPAVLVHDPAFSGKIPQVESSPYYVLTRDQCWDRSFGRGYYYDIEGAGGTTFREQIKVGFSVTQAASIERTLGVKVTEEGGFSFVADLSGAKLTGTASIKREITDQLKVTTSTSTTRMTEEIREVTVTIPPGRHVRVSWGLVDRYTLRRYDGSKVTEWEVVSKSVRVDDSYPD